MTITEIIAAIGPIAKDCAAVAGTLGALAMTLAHAPFMPAKYAEFFARFATYASQTFSVNRRDTQPKPPSAPYVPVNSQTFPDPPPPPDLPRAAFAGLGRLASLALCVAALVYCSCSPADIAAERKAAADGQAKLDQYCDARVRALQSPDGGEAGSK